MPQVLDAVVQERVYLKPWIEVMRHRSRHQVDRGERAHLLVLYHTFCDLAACGDSRVRALTSDILHVIGTDLGLA